MEQDHPFDLTIDANRKVFEYIKGTSAHSDLSELLIATVKPLEGVQIFSPDNPNGYGYYAVSTKGIIFGFAMGTDTIAFKLDDQMKVQAIAAGGKAYPECGPDWVSFIPFPGDGSGVDFELWARKAYVYAREAVQ